MVGQVFMGRYKVLRLLDEGGMSRVYVGMQLDRPREVAIKVLRDHLASQPKPREHFRREIHILSRFQHPHTVAYFDAGPDERQPFLVMEYLRGLDLDRLRERHKRFSAERAGRLLGQLCEVLHAAHEQGVIHRDLKPGNVMVIHPDTPQESIKLMDFGLAKMSALYYICPEDLHNIPQPTASGTPEYISPEQIRGNDVDRRSDVYSLGVLAYEMLTGHRPFERGSVEELLLAHMDATPPPFSHWGVKDVPPEVEDVVQACLAKYPEHRPKNAEELALAYEEALGKKIYDPEKARVAPARPAATAPPPKPRSSGRVPCVTADRLAAAADRHAIVHTLHVTQSETLVMLKLKGFIHDLGGEIVESVPGLIRVKVAEVVAVRRSGLFRVLGAGAATVQATPLMDLELKMETQAGRLAVTLTMRPVTSSVSAEWRTKCEKLTRDLQAYLMGR